jgi:hypothetical protein
MTPPSPPETLLRAQDDLRLATGSSTRGLSPEILSRSARRVRILALMYAFTFFMAAFLPNLIFEDARANMLAGYRTSSPSPWP